MDKKKFEVNNELFHMTTLHNNGLSGALYMIFKCCFVEISKHVSYSFPTIDS
jgi:hypothetical protein